MSYLNVSNLVVSSLGRQLYMKCGVFYMKCGVFYMKCGVFYMRRCEQSRG
jgi:uncharacterized membrane protein